MNFNGTVLCNQYDLENMDKENKRSYSLFVLGVLRYLCKLILHLFLANNMLPVFYGDYNIAMKCLKMFMVLSVFGTNTPIFLSKYIKTHKQKTAAIYVAWNLKLIIKSFSITIFIATLSTLCLIAVHYSKFIDMREYHLVLLMLWVSPIAAICLLLRSYALSNKQVYIAALFPNMVSVLQILLFATVILYLKLGLSNLLVVAVILFSYIFVALMSFFFLDKKILLLLIEGYKNIKRINKIVESRWFTTSSKLIVSNMTYSLITMADLLVVKIFAANRAGVGHYAAILLVTSSIWLIPKRVFLSLRPHYSTLMLTHEGQTKLHSMFDKPAATVTLIIILVCAGIILLSKQLLALFGPTYPAAHSTLIIMTLFVGVSAILRTDKAVLLSYSGYERFVLMVNVIELVLVLVTTIPATIYYGIMGTAIATGLVILTIKPLAIDYFIYKKFGMPPRFVDLFRRFF